MGEKFNTFLALGDCKICSQTVSRLKQLKENTYNLVGAFQHFYQNLI